MGSRGEQRKKHRRKQIFFCGIFIFILAASIVITGRILQENGRQIVAVDFPVEKSNTLEQQDIEPSKDGDKQLQQGKATIVVDAGHGGFDVGTQGGRTGIYEMDINLAIAKELEKELEEAGFSVIMTRETSDAIAETKEEDMQKRSDIIAGNEVDLMVSIHQNWFQNEDASGPQVFYMPGSAQGSVLANKIQNSLINQLEIQHPRTEKAEDYRLLKAGHAPAVIVECGFLSNPQDEANLSDATYQKKVAQAVAKGVQEYWQNR